MDTDLLLVAKRLLQRPIAFHRAFASISGSVCAGVIDHRVRG